RQTCVPGEAEPGEVTGFRRKSPPSRRVGSMSVVLEILDLARWAPSGDNSQPWRFEVLGDDHVRVHAFDTRRDCVYDLEGHASQLSVGALLETIRIAAGAYQRVASIV